MEETVELTVLMLACVHVVSFVEMFARCSTDQRNRQCGGQNYEKISESFTVRKGKLGSSLLVGTVGVWKMKYIITDKYV